MGAVTLTLRSTAADDPPGKPVGHEACESESSQVSEPKLPGAIRLFRAAIAHPRCKNLQTRRGAPPLPGQQGARSQDAAQPQLAGQQPRQSGEHGTSAQSGRERPTCRCSTATSCRRTKINTSLAASLPASSTSQPKRPDHEQVDDGSARAPSVNQHVRPAQGFGAAEGTVPGAAAIVGTRVHAEPPGQRSSAGR